MALSPWAWAFATVCMNIGVMALVKRILTVASLRLRL